PSGRSVAHHALPPFPTRRSSDLTQAIRAAQNHAVFTRDVAQAVLLGEAELAHLAKTRTEYHGRAPAHLTERTQARGDIFRRHREDRKSTRLNSSHVKISYAVFCL